MTDDPARPHSNNAETSRFVIIRQSRVDPLQRVGASRRLLERAKRNDAQSELAASKPSVEIQRPMALTGGLPIDRDSVERLVDLAESVYAGGQDTFEAGVAKSMTAILAYYTFLNEQLWGHYQIDGIDAVEGDEMRLVKLPSESMRGGLLTQGTVLAVTSNPDRTSPVKRGLFILENLLGTPPAAPPPNIPALEDVEPDAEKRPTT